MKGSVAIATLVTLALMMFLSHLDASLTVDNYPLLLQFRLLETQPHGLIGAAVRNSTVPVKELLLASPAPR